MILITGASGFIGRALTNKLSLLNHEIIEINSKGGGVTNKKIIDALLHEDITYVFHLAGKTFVPESWQKPYDFYSLNVSGTLNVLEFCKKKDVGLTYISSYLYGIPKQLPIKEDAPVNPNNPYAHSKFLAEQLCDFYVCEFGVKANILRPFNVYGIGQDKNFLIPYIIDQALNNDIIQLKDLAPRRDYVYLLDLVDALICSMENKDKSSVYNIGSGVSISVQEVVDVVSGVLSIKKPVLSEEVIRKNEINNVVADITKARNELNWQPRFSFNDGIQQIIDFEQGKYNE